MPDATIKAITTTILRVPWPQTQWLRGHPFGDTRDLLVLDLETSEGIAGMGYLFLFAPTMKTITACLEETIVPRVLGKDATAVEAIWQDLWRASVTYGRGGIAAMAMSLLDIALWDRSASGRSCRCIGCGAIVARNCRLTAAAVSAAAAATA